MNKEKEKNKESQEIEKTEEIKKIDTKEFEEIKKKAQEYDSLWDKYLRVCAELDNARKRWEREKEEVIRFANFKLMKEIISFLDNLEKTIEGMKLTYKNFLNLLSQFGLKRIEAKGKKFDPYYHEIVGQKETEEDKEHIVLEEVQPGYLLEDKVLRTSKVIVGVKKNNSKDNSTGGDRDG